MKKLLIMYLTTFIFFGIPVHGNTDMECVNDKIQTKKFFKVNPKKKLFYERIRGQWIETSDACPSNPYEIISRTENRNRNALFAECKWKNKEYHNFAQSELKSGKRFLCEPDELFERSEYFNRVIKKPLIELIREGYCDCNILQNDCKVTVEGHGAIWEKVKDLPKYRITSGTSSYLVDFETRYYEINGWGHECKTIK